MKSHFLLLLTGLLLIQCTVDTDPTELNSLENIEATSRIRLTNTSQKPNPELDDSKLGLYQGTLATHDLAFHESITINFGNDGAYNAIIKTQGEESYTFTGTPLSKTTDAVLYKGKLGQFKARSGNKKANNQLEIYDAIINNTATTITGYKDRSTQRAASSPGNFISDDGTLTGTWDFVYTGFGGDSIDIVGLNILTNQGTLFELTASGSYVRTCNGFDNIFDFFFSSQESVGVNLANSNLIYTVNGFASNPPGSGCDPFGPSQDPSNGISPSGTWTWNGITGTATLSAVPLFDSGF